MQAAIERLGRDRLRQWLPLATLVVLVVVAPFGAYGQEEDPALARHALDGDIAERPEVGADILLENRPQPEWCLRPGGAGRAENRREEAKREPATEHR